MTCFFCKDIPPWLTGTLQNWREELVVDANRKLCLLRKVKDKASIAMRDMPAGTRKDQLKTAILEAIDGGAMED